MKKRIAAAVFAFLIIAAALLLTVKIKNISVSGNAWYTKEQIEEMLLPEGIARNSAYCFINSIAGKKKPLPFIQDYRISFDSPFSVEIIVYEKSIVGYVSYMSSNMYFDKDGIVVESSGKKLEGIPWITGLKFGQIVLYEPLPVENGEIFDEILNLTQVLSVYQVNVDNIRFDSSGEAYLGIGDIDVVLGGSSEINGKIAELKDMLPKIRELNGTLYLDTYDPKDDRVMYTFKKND